MAEGLHAEKSTLRTLAEMAECDVRCCLNTLQFMSRKKECVCLEDLRGLSLGKKDVNRSAFDIWQDLLFTRVRWCCRGFDGCGGVYWGVWLWFEGLQSRFSGQKIEKEWDMKTTMSHAACPRNHPSPIDAADARWEGR